MTLWRTREAAQSAQGSLSYCKKVRDDNNYWQQVESYIGEKIGANLSHGVCPECYQNIVQPQLDELKKNPMGELRP